jgi:hypothetical protein
MKAVETEEDDLSYAQHCELYGSSCFTYKSNKIVKELSQTNKLFKYP